MNLFQEELQIIGDKVDLLTGKMNLFQEGNILKVRKVNLIPFITLLDSSEITERTYLDL